MNLLNTKHRGLLTRIVASAAPAVLLAGSMTGCGYDDRYDDRPVRVTRVERVERVRTYPQQQVVDEQPMLEPQQPVETTTVVEEQPYTPPPAEVVTTYQTELQPYGEWVETREYGRCWVPRGRPAGWRPYTMGRWQYSDQREWMWVSEGDEADWGVVTYHYGRWYEEPSRGWVWVPGSTWAPAWVSWREGGGYCGWAPLPPRIRDGYRVNAVVVDRYVPADRYVFVEDRYIGQPRVHEHVVRNNVTIINQTTNITNITYVNNRVVNRGVQVEKIERASNRKIEPVHTVQVSSREQAKTLAAQGKPVIFEPPAIRKAAVQQQQTVKVQYQQKNKTVQKDPVQKDPTATKIRPDGQISPVEARQIEQQREADDKARQQAERDRLAKERERNKFKNQNDPKYTQQNLPKNNQPQNLHVDQGPINNKTNPPKTVTNVNPKVDQDAQAAERRRLQAEQQHELDLRKQQQQDALKKQQQDALKTKQQDSLKTKQAQEDMLRKQQQQEIIRRQQEQELLLKKQQQQQDEEKRNREKVNQQNNNPQPKVVQQKDPQPKVVQQTTNQPPPNPKDPRDPRNKDKNKDPNAKE